MCSTVTAQPHIMHCKRPINRCNNLGTATGKELWCVLKDKALDVSTPTQLGQSSVGPLVAVMFRTSDTAWKPRLVVAGIKPAFPVY